MAAVQAAGGLWAAGSHRFWDPPVWSGRQRKWARPTHSGTRRAPSPRVGVGCPLPRASPQPFCPTGRPVPPPSQALEALGSGAPLCRPQGPAGQLPACAELDETTESMALLLITNRTFLYSFQHSGCPRGPAQLGRCSHCWRSVPPGRLAQVQHGPPACQLHWLAGPGQS